MSGVKSVRSTFNLIVKIYLVLTVIVTLLSRIVPIKVLVGERFDSIVYIVLALLGAIFLLLDVFITRKWYKGRHVFVLYGFIVVMAISTLLNIRYGLVDNIKTMVWTGIQFGLIYTMYLRSEKIEMFAFVDNLWLFISSIWIVPVGYSIWQFIAGHKYRVAVSSTVSLRQGFYDNRLFGVFNDPNYAAIMCLGMALACLYLFNKHKNKLLRTFLLINCVLQIWYMILSGSRTALVVSLAVLVVFSCLYIREKLRHHKMLLKIFVGGLATVFSAFIVVGGTVTVQNVSLVLPKMYATYIGSNTITDNTHNDDINNPDWDVDTDIEEPDAFNPSLNRTDTDVNNISNNRTAIWKAYLNGLQDDWVFGGSPRNFLAKWIEKNPEGYLAESHYETHNGYLSVLVGTGVAGAAVILTFVALYLFSCFKFLRKNKVVDKEFVFTFLFLISIVIYTFFFTDLFFIHNYTSVMFWLHCGLLQYWLHEKKKA